MELESFKFWRSVLVYEWFLKKIFYSNLVQNFTILIISVIYFNFYYINGIEQVSYLLIIYLIYFIFLLYEFYNYEKNQIQNTIKVYNLLSFIVVLLYMLGGIDFFKINIAILVTLAVILLNFSRYIVLLLYTKKKGVKFIDIDKEFDGGSVKLNAFEITILIIGFLFLTINISTRIQVLISIALITLYFIMYHKRINNFKFIFILIQTLIILKYYGISGILNYSIYGLIFMLLFRKTK